LGEKELTPRGLFVKINDIVYKYIAVKDSDLIDIERVDESASVLTMILISELRARMKLKNPSASKEKINDNIKLFFSTSVDSAAREDIKGGK